MTGPTLVFDLETQRLTHEVGGWGNIAGLGLAAAVTLDAESGQVRRYLEPEAPALIADLRAAGRVIGYNLLGFDYEVLTPYGLDPLELAAPGRTLDLEESLSRLVGFHVSLENVAAATLGGEKSADGVAAVAWYREGKIDKVLDYCEADVRLTFDLWQHGRRLKIVRYRDSGFRLREVAVAW